MNVTLFLLLFFLQISPPPIIENDENYKLVREILEQRRSDIESAQDSVFIGALSCEGAYDICTVSDLKFSNTITPNTDFPLVSLCFGVGVPHNLTWWSYKGDGQHLSLTLKFDIRSCEIPFGIQAGVFEGKCDGSIVWDCNSSCNTSTFTMSGPTVLNEVYYLWVDGCNGDVCTFEIEFHSSTILDCSLPDPMPPPRFGSQYYCYDNELYLFPPLPWRINYTWKINGDTYETFGNEPVILSNLTEDSVRIALISELKSFGPLDSLLDFDTSSFVIPVPMDTIRVALAGTTHYTLSDSCLWTGNESTIGLQLLEFKDSNNVVLRTRSDRDGNYSICVSPNEYSARWVEVPSAVPWSRCFADTILSIRHREDHDFNFLLHLPEYCWRPKFTVYRPARDRQIRCDGRRGRYPISIKNISPLPLSAGSLVIWIDSLVSIDEVVKSNYTKTNDQVKLFYPELGPYEIYKDELILSSKCSGSDLGKSFCIYAQFDETPKLCNGDAPIYWCQELRNSYDPNLIEAFPIGETEFHYIENEEVIDYTVHFENEGNDFAYDIRIEHEFTKPFNPETFEFVDASHEEISIVISNEDPRKVTIFFPNIYLNYTKANEEESKGWVRYKLVMDSLPELSTFESHADIYFDYNPAIKTNTLLHTITTDFFRDSIRRFICEGDLFWGRLIERDTIISDTLVQPGPDNITTFLLETRPVYKKIEVDTLICPGEIITWRNMNLIHARDYKVRYFTQEGCDSVFLAYIHHKFLTKTTVDTIVDKGDMVRGVLINSDTSFIHRLDGDSTCVDLTYNIMVRTTSANDLPANSLLISPNPFTDQIRIQVENEQWLSASVILRDIYGNPVWQNDKLTSDNICDTQTMTAGLYYLQVNLDDQVWVKPMVKL